MTVQGNIAEFRFVPVSLFKSRIALSLSIVRATSYIAHQICYLLGQTTTSQGDTSRVGPGHTLIGWLRSVCTQYLVRSICP